MKLVVERDPENDLYTARLVIEGYELLETRLTEFDLLLLRECEHSESIADKLLGLETLTRRIEETYAKEGRKSE